MSSFKLLCLQSDMDARGLLTFLNFFILPKKLFILPVFENC
jgi:hypothetical protein